MVATYITSLYKSIPGPTPEDTTCNEPDLTQWTVLTDSAGKLEPNETIFESNLYIGQCQGMNKPERSKDDGPYTYPISLQTYSNTSDESPTGRLSVAEHMEDADTVARESLNLPSLCARGRPGSDGGILAVNYPDSVSKDNLELKSKVPHLSTTPRLPTLTSDALSKM